MNTQEPRQQTCCFTGHRNVPKKDVDQILKQVEMLVCALVKKGVETFCVGGAIGFDTIAAQHLLYLRDIKGLNIKVILICPFDGFTNRWNQTQKDEFATLLPHFDEVIYKEKTGSREAYLSRNRELVNRSAYCIAYCTHNYGGTAYTVRYAMKSGVMVLNIADTDVDIF